MADELLSGTVTFLFTDIEGSTQLVRRLRDGYADVLAEHGRLIEESFAAHGGRVVDTQGDAYFAVFPRARDAVEAAVAAQRALGGHEWPEGGEVRVRMGLHTGEPVVGEGRYVGLGVNRAARICAAGHGGQVLLSAVTRDLAEDELAEGWELRDLGDHELKDLPRPERVFQLVAPGLDTDFPSLRTAQIEAFAGHEGELAEDAQAALAPAWYRRRSLLAGALAGVVAAAIAIPLFAFAGRSGEGGTATAQADSVAVLDPESGKLAGDVPLDGAPSAVAAGEGAVWVTHASTHTVSKIGYGSTEVNDTVPVGDGPTAIAVGGGAVWVANGLDGTVSRIDPGDGTERRIPVGNLPSGVTYAQGVAWVINSADGTVSRLGPDGKPAGPPLPAGAAGPGIAVGGGAVWVTDRTGRTVTRTEIGTRARERITVGNGPTGIVFDRGSVWVANSLDGSVTKIDAETRSVRATTPVGAGATAVAVSRGRIWVATEFGGQVVRLVPATGQVEGTTRTGAAPVALSASPDGLRVALAGSGTAHRGGTLRVVAEPFDSIDPALGYDVGPSSVLTLTSDGLVAFRRTGGSNGAQLVPDLATSLPLPSNAGRTYTFQLRPGLRYSDGTPVRPSDFRRAIERVFLLRSDTAYLFQSLVGAGRCAARPRGCDLSDSVVTDDAALTVTFRLAVPDPEFLYKLALPTAYPVPRGVGMRAGEQVPGTGSYMVASWRPGREVVLVRNPLFEPWSHAAQPGGYADRIRFELREGAGPGSAVRGSTDVLLDSPQPRALAGLPLRFAPQVRVNLEPSTWAFIADTRIPPFDRVAVRRAFNLAVDRRLAMQLFGGRSFARPTCQVFPPNFPAYAKYCPYPLDLAKARRLVKAAGARGARVTVWTTPFRPPALELARYAVRVLRQIGLRASLKQVADPQRYFGAFFDSRRDVQVGVYGWFAAYASPSDFFTPNFACRSPTNGAHFCDAAVSAGIVQARRLQLADPSVANGVWARLDRRVVDAAAWVPLVNTAHVNVVSRRVGNFQYNPQWGVLLDQLWVE